MGRWIALFAIVATLFIVVTSQCASPSTIPDPYNQYVITICPLLQALPVTLTNITTPVFSSNEDGISRQIILPFPVQIYGVDWDHVRLNTNGALFFGATGSTAAQATFPLSHIYGDSLPVIAAAWQDILMETEAVAPDMNSQIVHSTQGTVGNRHFIVRYSNMRYVSLSTVANVMVSFDVVFYENPSRQGDVEIRYYRLDMGTLPSDTWRLTTIGMQSYDDGTSYWSMAPDSLYGDTNQSLLAHQLVGKEMLIQYIGEDLVNTTCGGLGYNLTSLRGADLTYTDDQGNQYFFNPCGEVINALCANNPTTEKAMICMVPSTADSLPVDLGDFGPGSVKYELPVGGNGVNMLLQNGEYCSDLGAEIYTRIQFVCDPTSITPRLLTVVQDPAPCVFIATVNTNRACGGAVRDNSTIYRASTLPQCTYTNGLGYAGVMCPRPSNMLEPRPLTAPIKVLAGVYRGTARAALPFPFIFYGQSYNYVNISVKGSLFFGETRYESSPSQFPNIGMYDESWDAWPAILGLGGEFTTQVMRGIPSPNISYSSQRDSAGRWQFIVRYWDMRFPRNIGLIDQVISFDIVLTEGDFSGQSGVEIKYYVVSPSNNYATIGIHGTADPNIYTGHTNWQTLTATLAFQIQGTTLNFTYIGKSRYDACAAFGVNFTQAVTTDLQFFNPTTNSMYSVHPCGVLTGSSACRSGTSVCQVTNNVPTVLSTFNPSSIIWSTAPAPLLGIRSTLRDGTYCFETSSARSVQIDWICSRSSPVTHIVQVVAINTCTTNVQIYSPIACDSKVVCSTTQADEYTGTLCPSNPLTPRLRLTNESAPILVGLDDSAVRVNLPFKVKVYGQSYGRVFVGTNGVLAFGPRAMTAGSGRIPLFGSSLDTAPLLAAFWADLRIVDQSRITYSNEVINHTRAFVVRYDQIEYWSNNIGDAADSASFDVILSESGRIEVRYYGLNPSSDATSIVSIGLMSNDETGNLVLMNSRGVDAATAASLSNSTWVLQYYGPDYDNAPCGTSTGYDLSSLIGRDYIFNDTLHRNLYTVSVCSPVRNEVCLGESEKTAFCQQPYNALGVPNTVNIVAEYEPINTYYQYPRGVSTGVQMIVQGGLMCNARSRVGVYNLICDPATTSPQLLAVYEPSTCVYYANITTNAVCSAGNRGNANNNTGPFFSTLTACQTIPGRLYDATLCPRSRSDPYTMPERLTNPVRILATDNDVLLLNISFPFFLYDVPETQVSISSNGLLTFGFETLTSGVPAGFPSMGLDSRWYPNIAAFWTNLINYDTSGGVIPYQGFIEYSRENGATPGAPRRLIFRFQDVDYYQGRDSFAELSASFDVILTEGQPGGIEVRYYQIDPNTLQNVVIGMHGYRNDYTSVRNLLPLNNVLASELQGITLRYTYTGRHVDDICSGVAGGYNLTSISGHDLVYNTLGYTYYFRPCGTVTAADCVAQYATSRVSLCQATIRTSTAAQQYTFALAGDAVASTTFSSNFGSNGEEILRATITDGQFCDVTGTPRMSIIDYVCDRSATTAYISFLAENSTCVYYVRVMTAASCQVPLTCTSYPGNLYNARLCNANSIMENKIVQTAPVDILTPQDGSNYELTLPFSFHIYGQAINNIFIYVNGYISFGSEAMYQYTGTLPFASDVIGGLPFMAFYMCELNNQNSFGNSSITYSIEGTYPNRFLLVRYNDITHWQNTVSDGLLSFDVKLYEGGEGRAEVLYYKQSPQADSNCTIGIQSNDGASYTAIANYLQIPDSSISVQDKFLRWFYTGEDSTNVPRCGGLGYNFLSIMDFELSYVSDTTSIYYMPCGVIAAPACAFQYTTARSMACAVIQYTDYTANQNLAVYNPTAAVWSYLPNGVQQYMATGSYCWDTMSPSITYTNFICNALALEPRIISFTSSDGYCVNVITIETSLACGPGNRPPAVARPPVRSTLSSCYTVAGAHYNAEVCPRNETDPYFYPANFTNANNILVVSDNAVENVQIPFPFSFYGRVFTELNISTNGLLQFGEASTNQASASLLGSMPVSIRNWPVIAAFWSDLWNAGSLGEGSLYEGKIQWGIIGAPPTRQMVIRFYMIDFFTYRYYPAVTGVSFDVFLKEGENQDIQIRYYRVDANPSTYMTIGLRADNISQSANTAVQNYELITATKASQIAGSTITYRYTGQSASAACGAFGYSVQAIKNADVTFNHSNGRTYVHRPCGVVSNAACAAAPVTEHSSLCELQGSVALYSGSAYSPSSISWTRLADGIESSQQTGTYCRSPLAAPRIANIKYICSAAYTTPRMTNIVVVSQCTYNATVMTSVVCTPFVPSSSSSTAGAVSSASAPVPSSAPGSSAASSSAASTSSARPSSTAAVASSSPSLIPLSSSTASNVQSSSSATRPSNSSSTAPSAPSSTAIPVNPSSSATPSPVSSSSGDFAEVDSSGISSLGDGAIAGIVIGVIVGALLLVLLVFFLCVNRAGKGATRLEDDQTKNRVENSNVAESRVNSEREEVEMAEV